MIILLRITAIMAALLSQVPEQDYRNDMQVSLQALNNTDTEAEYLQLASRFAQIGDANPAEWLPYYYAGFCYTSYCFLASTDEDLDNFLDQAEVFLGKARLISPENAEIEVLQGWIHQGRIKKDPFGRGMVYSEKAAASFGKAMNIDPSNPRIFYLTGMNVLYTPEFFGGGKAAACPYFLEAKEKFESFRPASDIDPDWGRQQNEEQAETCTG
jgi:hypothetical protein